MLNLGSTELFLQALIVVLLSGIALLGFFFVRRSSGKHSQALEVAQLQQLLYQQDAAARQNQDAFRQELTKRFEQSNLQTFNSIQTAFRNLEQSVVGANSAASVSLGKITEQLSTQQLLSAEIKESAQNLNRVLANNSVRGQLGEQMAEDVLKAAGYIEGVGYLKQVGIAGNLDASKQLRPDFAFPLPNGDWVFLDVKFPLAKYKKAQQAETKEQKNKLLKEFFKDVERHVKDLQKRDYAAASKAGLPVLMFIPNDQFVLLIQEQKPDLIEKALESNVVFCSPMSLLIYLKSIRHATKVFKINEANLELLEAFRSFESEWAKFQEPIDKIERGIASAHNAYLELAGVRRNKLQSSMQKIKTIQTQALDIEAKPSTTAALNNLDTETDTEAPALASQNDETELARKAEAELGSKSSGIFAAEGWLEHRGLDDL